MGTVTWVKAMGQGTPRDTGTRTQLERRGHLASGHRCQRRALIGQIGSVPCQAREHGTVYLSAATAARAPSWPPLAPTGPPCWPPLAVTPGLPPGLRAQARVQSRRVPRHRERACSPEPGCVALEASGGCCPAGPVPRARRCSAGRDWCSRCANQGAGKEEGTVLIHFSQTLQNAVENATGLWFQPLALF